MATDLGKTFGFELLYKVSEAQITKKEDVLILFVHWYFIKNGFKCLGIGDSKTIDPTERGSELLPDGWNQAPNYTLRYVREEKLYILMGIKSEADLLLNLLRIEDHSVSNVQFPIDVVKELKGSLELLIPNYETILNTLKTDLIEPVYTGTGREVSTQTPRSRSDMPTTDDDPLRVESPYRPSDVYVPRPHGNRIRRIHSNELEPIIDPTEIGRNDLDPFRRGGASGIGGMIFDPFENRRTRPPYPGLGVPGRLPPGAVPPGARFDPFGPPDNDVPNRRAEVPDADHLPPAGYDDMFM